MDGESVHRKIERLMEHSQCSFVARDLVSFFQHNPGADGTLSSLTIRLQRAEGEVKVALEGLVEARLLAKKEIAGSLHYIYRPDPVALLEISKSIHRVNRHQEKLKSATERFRKSRLRTTW